MTAVIVALARQRVRRAGLRLAVLRRWPLLFAEWVVMAGLVGFVSGPAAAILFALLTLLMLTAPFCPDMIEADARGGRYRAHLNLYLQKIGCVSLVFFFADMGATLQAIQHYAAHTVLVPVGAAVLVASWWSPEIDSRWRIAGSNDEPDKHLKDEEYDSQ